ncbi:MAG: hypothetical protein JWO84_126 [Parcubacteria group bacterium]|nr:hypothetical protein [Parcubacteria group bacterium]
MNLEDLSKTQLLLLTVLVNFVTSIAIGVLTVSLLDQAPPTITQTVNRIVDHTVQTIASTTPIQSIIQAPAPATVVIHDEDLLTAALAANASRAVTIYAHSTSTPAIAVGTFVPKARAVATATSVDLPKEALIVFADGSTVPASLSRSGATLSIYGFADSATLPKVPVPLLSSKASLKQGQSVLAIARDGSALTGIVSRIDDSIHTSLTNVPVGSSAVNSSGNIIGIAIDSIGTFASADKINTLLTATSSPAAPY